MITLPVCLLCLVAVVVVWSCLIIAKKQPPRF